MVLLRRDLYQDIANEGGFTLDELIRPISTVTAGGFGVETYLIDVPDDLFTDPTQRADYAIYSARESCEVWIVPALWSVTADNGSTVTVERTYNAKS